MPSSGDDQPACSRPSSRALRICGQASDLGILVVQARLAVDFEHLIEGVGGVVGELPSALDALAAEDLDDCRPGSSWTGSGLVAAQNKLAAVPPARCAGRPDPGRGARREKSMASWLRTPPGSPRRRPAAGRGGRALEALPAVEQCSPPGGSAPRR